MKEQMKMLKSYREEIEVLTLTMDVPSYDYDDKRRNMFFKYEDVLLKLFNNKRDNKEILKIRNYYNSNKITIEVNLTQYLEDSYDTKEQVIEHLKDWMSSGLDVANKDIEANTYKGYIYSVDLYDNNIEWQDGDDIIENYIEWAE